MKTKDLLIVIMHLEERISQLEKQVEILSQAQSDTSNEVKSDSDCSSHSIWDEETQPGIDENSVKYARNSDLIEALQTINQDEHVKSSMINDPKIEMLKLHREKGIVSNIDKLKTPTQIINHNDFEEIRLFTSPNSASRSDWSWESGSD